MKLALTLEGGKEIVVDSERISIMEPWPLSDGQLGTHIVFGADLGRVVAESLPSIAKAIGVTVPSPVPAITSLASLVDKPKRTAAKK